MPPAAELSGIGIDISKKEGGKATHKSIKSTDTLQLNKLFTRDDEPLDCTIWALQATDKENHISTDSTVALPKDATILDAADMLKETLWQDYADRGYYVKEKIPPAETLLKWMNTTNDRDSSLFIIRIYPPQYGLQEEYGELSDKEMAKWIESH